MKYGFAALLWPQLSCDPGTKRFSTSGRCGGSAVCQNWAIWGLECGAISIIVPSPLLNHRPPSHLNLHLPLIMRIWFNPRNTNIGYTLKTQVFRKCTVLQYNLIALQIFSDLTIKSESGSCAKRMIIKLYNLGWIGVWEVGHLTQRGPKSPIFFNFLLVQGRTSLSWKHNY